MLAQMVARGELPPVDQRLPEQPKVVEPVESVGRYGGEFNVYALDNMPWNDLVEGTVVGASWVLEMTADGEIVPDVARATSSPLTPRAERCNCAKVRAGRTARPSPRTTFCLCTH